MQQSNSFDKLYEAIINIRSTEECKSFLEDICTIKEMMDLSQRLEVALLLNEGKSYTEIANQTKASTATISRVNRCFTYGNGGYKVIIDRMVGENKNDEA